MIKIFMLLGMFYFREHLSDNSSPKSTVPRNVKMKMFFMNIFDRFTVRSKHKLYGRTLLKVDAPQAMISLDAPRGAIPTLNGTARWVG